MILISALRSINWIFKQKQLNNYIHFNFRRSEFHKQKQVHSNKSAEFDTFFSSSKLKFNNSKNISTSKIISD